MPSSSVLIAKRSLVSLLLRLAVAYHVVVSVKRTSPDAGVKAAFRKVALKVHPDKGGDKAEFQNLHEAKERWEAAAKSSKNGRPAQAHNKGGMKAPRNPADSLCTDLADSEECKKQYHLLARTRKTAPGRRHTHKE